MNQELRSVDCTLCQNSLGLYCVPISSQHRPAPQVVLRGEVWEAETVEFMRKNHGGRSIVHAGTYFGDFLPGLSSALAPGQVIYGFEPNPENFACAQWTVLLNKLSNVRLYNFGLGAGRTSVAMRMFENGVSIGGGSHILSGGNALADNEDVHEIEIVALDNVISTDAEIGILQLDVETYEEFALAGAMGLIARCKPIIIVETVPIDFVERRLAPLGYKRAGNLDANALFVA
jgi:FkbM family methyltransferase